MLEVNVGAILDRIFRRYRNQTAFTVEGRQYKHGQIEASVNKLANGFLSLGLQKGERIVIMTGNCIEYIYTDFAAAKIGLVKAPLDIMVSVRDIDYRIRDSEASTIVLDEFFYNRAGSLLKEYDFVKHVICITEDEKILSQGVAGFYRLLDSSPSSNPNIDVVPDDLIAIMYTGGTTGLAKGVMHTHKSYLSIVYSQLVENDVREDEVVLLSAPLPHATGFNLVPALLKGGRIVVTNGFNPEEFFRLVQEERITWTFMVPTMIYTILDHPKRKDYDLSSLKTILYGAAPISPRRLQEAVREMGPIFMQGYAQMEIATQGTVLSKKEHVDALRCGQSDRLKSCGRPVTVCQMKIADENNREVEAGTVGEVIARGPHMMKGYWRKEEETRRTIVDGWVHTGDLGFMDSEEYVYLVDRKNDVIITGGMSVFSVEIENVLSQHPAVSEVMVIGVPDEKWGEVVLAVVVKAPGKEVTESELLAYCRDKLAAYQRPKRVEFYEALPKTIYGKADKKTVKKKYWEGRDRMI
jgi:acyl-CoA synthetase (AMP-forming)/AMP-acid ligase II